MNFYKNKTILVTGGVGSIGSEIVRSLLKYNPHRIRVFDNNETGLFDLNQELSSEKIRPFVGDIRDRARLKRAAKGVDIVFHAAALKHVSLCEYNPFEAIQTNVIGTQNVIDAALDVGVKKMINISTDKAVNPINVMGATKLLTERLTAAANYYRGKKETVFSSVRFGNVLNSRGSIIPLLKQQFKKGRIVTLTNSQMTRFVMGIPRAVDLVLKSAQMAKGGEIFILKMSSVLVRDLFEALIKELAPEYGYKPEEIKIKIIGQRPGEKLHEELMTEDEAKTASYLKEMFIISPKIERTNSKKSFSKKDYSSKNSPFLNKKEIRKLLKTVLSSSILE
jgi:FlaA1/EpsC-like NDP-sugar epimerase